MIDIILQWAIPTILTLLLGFVTKELKENKKSNQAMRNSMIALLRSQITGKADTYLGLGYLPNYARLCLQELFKEYTALGGNHGMEELVNQCFKLPPMKLEER